MKKVQRKKELSHCWAPLGHVPAILNLWMSQLEPTPSWDSFPLPRRAEMLKNTRFRNKANFQLSTFPLPLRGGRLRAQSWAWRSYPALNQRINTKNCLYLWKWHLPRAFAHGRHYKEILQQDLLCLAETGQRAAILCLISILEWKQHNPDYCTFLKGRMDLCIYIFFQCRWKKNKKTCSYQSTRQIRILFRVSFRQMGFF